MKWTTIQIRKWKWKLQKTWFWLWKTRFYKIPVICNCFRWPISIKWDDSWSFFCIIGLYEFFEFSSDSVSSKWCIPARKIYCRHYSCCR